MWQKFLWLKGNSRAFWPSKHYAMCSKSNTSSTPTNSDETTVHAFVFTRSSTCLQFICFTETYWFRHVFCFMNKIIILYGSFHYIKITKPLLTFQGNRKNESEVRQVKKKAELFYLQGRTTVEWIEMNSFKQLKSENIKSSIVCSVVPLKLKKYVQQKRQK